MPSFKPAIEMIMLENNFSLSIDDSGRIQITHHASGQTDRLTRKHCITRVK